MNTLRNIALTILSVVIGFLMLSGFATLGLIAIGIAFAGSLVAVGIAAWKNRSNLTTQYTVAAT